MHFPKKLCVTISFHHTPHSVPRPPLGEGFLSGYTYLGKTGGENATYLDSRIYQRGGSSLVHK